jgi:hypothetical protein
MVKYGRFLKYPPSPQLGSIFYILPLLLLIKDKSTAKNIKSKRGLKKL